MDVDGLGFAVTFEVPGDGGRGLLGLARGTIRLRLDCSRPAIVGPPAPSTSSIRRATRCLPIGPASS
jgi:hypothetical protein